MKYCQGPACHQYTTKDRLKGPAGSKTYQTRRRSKMHYGKGNFCSWNCQNDWREFENRTYVFRNKITEEQRSLTEEQYNDSNYTLNER